MGEVRRVYPESKTGLIKWIEENFHEIDEFVATFSLSDGTTMTVDDCCGEMKEYTPFINPLPKDWAHNRESNKDLCSHCSDANNINLVDVLNKKGRDAKS